MRLRALNCEHGKAIGARGKQKLYNMYNTQNVSLLCIARMTHGSWRTHTPGKMRRLRANCKILTDLYSSHILV